PHRHNRSSPALYFRFRRNRVNAMKADPEYLRQHYSSLPDEALLDIDRSELVEAAQRCYDDEMMRRGLAPQGSAVDTDGPRASRLEQDNPSAEEELSEQALDTGDISFGFGVMMGAFWSGGWGCGWGGGNVYSNHNNNFKGMSFSP